MYSSSSSDWDSSSSSDSSDYWSSSDGDGNAYVYDYHHSRPGQSSRSKHRKERTKKAQPSRTSKRNTHIETAHGVAIKNKFWPPDKSTLNVEFLDGSTSVKEEVKRVIRTHYHAVPMRIRFKFLKAGEGPSDIRITFADYSKSRIGTDAQHVHPLEPTMWLEMDRNDAQRQSNILHEFGHALGMKHEHSHPDCKINWNMRALAIKSGWSSEQVHQNYKRFKHGEVLQSPYDPQSIMHYPVYKGDTMSMVGQLPLNIVLSDGDKRFLMSNYPAAPNPKPPKAITERLKEKVPEKTKKKREDVTGKKEKSPEKPDRKNATLVSGAGDAVVNGGYVIIRGAGDVKVLGGGYVECHGSGDVVIYGDSHVKMTGSGDVRVYGRGTVEKTGSGDIWFSKR